MSGHHAISPMQPVLAPNIMPWIGYLIVVAPAKALATISFQPFSSAEIKWQTSAICQNITPAQYCQQSKIYIRQYVSIDNITAIQ
jgi:hypothetical protein